MNSPKEPIPQELLERVINAQVGSELTRALEEVKRFIAHRDGPMVNPVCLRFSTTKEVAECLDRVQAALDAGLLHGAEGLAALDYRDKLLYELERRREKADWEALMERQKNSGTGPGAVTVEWRRMDD